MLVVSVAVFALISSDRLFCQARLHINTVETVEKTYIPYDEPIRSEHPVEDFLDMIHEGPHLVVFYREGCIFSERFQPIWDEFVASTHDGIVEKHTTICNRLNQICEHMNVHAYPAIIWYENGKEFDRYYGERSVIKLQQYVDRMLQTPS